MRTATTFLLSLGVLVLATGVSAARAADDDDKGKELLGEYTIVAGEKGGTEIPTAEVKGHLVRITADTISVVDEHAEDIYVSKYKLDTTTTPYEVGMTMTGGPGAKEGATAKGIIKKEGDKVWLCYGVGDDRPKEFKTSKESHQLMFEMKKKSD